MSLLQESLDHTNVDIPRAGQAACKLVIRISSRRDDIESGGIYSSSWFPYKVLPNFLPKTPQADQNPAAPGALSPSRRSASRISFIRARSDPPGTDGRMVLDSELNQQELSTGRARAIGR